MVLTAVQMMAFFEGPNQMGISHDTVLQLHNQGITSVADLTDFDSNTLTTSIILGGRVPDPNPGAAVGTTIPTSTYYQVEGNFPRLFELAYWKPYHSTLQ